jgi:hypothetical protein
MEEEMFLLLCLLSPTRQVCAKEKCFMLCCDAKDICIMEKNCKKIASSTLPRRTQRLENFGTTHSELEK